MRVGMDRSVDKVEKREECWDGVWLSVLLI